MLVVAPTAAFLALIAPELSKTATIIPALLVGKSQAVGGGGGRSFLVGICFIILTTYVLTQPLVRHTTRVDISRDDGVAVQDLVYRPRHSSPVPRH